MRFYRLLALGISFSALPAAGQQEKRHFYFKPDVYYREFSATPAPVLRINVGDTVSTESVDAVGFDKSGQRVTERGNPLTGPFFVEGAIPGDVLAITLLKVSLNRNYATTLEAIIPKLLPKKTAKQTWRSAKLVKWNLDLATATGSPAVTHEHLEELRLPLHPFLGCIGVAPVGSKGISSSDSGPFGGNMDFKFNTQGATIYLPVAHAGGLLFLGDGHAAQGDGELNGDALETSMDFSFTVSLIKRDSLQLTHPIVENEQQLMFFGIAKTLDRATADATQTVLNWLQQHYGLSFREASQVIGPAIEYRIPKIAATKVEVVAILPRAILKQLR